MWLHALPLGSAIALFIILMVATEIGRRIGLSHDQDTEGRMSKGTAAIEGFMFALLGLLVAFLFSGAASRIIDRRDLIVQEANCIGTAYLRVDLFPAESQSAIRQLYRDYADARLRGVELIPDPAFEIEFQRATTIQGRIWTQSVAAARDAGNPAVMQLTIEAVNAMIDITATRDVAMRTHPPSLIYSMLVVLAIFCSIMVGRNIADRRFGKWPYRVAFTSIFCFAFMIILELEFPRIGFLQIDHLDAMMRAARAAMGP